MKRSPTLCLVSEALAVVFVAAFVARRGGAHASALVGIVFLAVCHLRSWRGDDARVRADGLALGGLAAPLVDARRGFARGLSALAMTVAVVFPPFIIAWCAFFRPVRAFEAGRAFADLDMLAELVLVALPEEAFFRGYLQSRLAERVSGRVGPLTSANAATSVLFALGHLGTELSVARASVFFPSLLFGLLRERTGGVIVPVVVHALSNALARVLAQGFGLV